MKRFLIASQLLALGLLVHVGSNHVASAAAPAGPGASIDGFRFEFPCKEPMPENPKEGSTGTSALVTGDPLKTDNFTNLFIVSGITNPVLRPETGS